MTTRYKFLRLENGKIRSQSGDLTWTKNKWHKIDNELVMCKQGLHCSLKMLDAFSYVSGDIVARVETKGSQLSQNDKEVWQSMRLVDVRIWDKKDSVALSIYAAGLCIDLYEKEFPGDDRPRKAIEAAEAWLKNPSPEAAEAAEAAGWAAGAAGAARWAAEAAEAARAARAAGWAAGAAGAARWAAEAARAAGWAAGAAGAAEAAGAAGAAGAARWAAEAARINTKINTWMEARFDTLEKYKEVR